ncbi:MarR family winged helix-turn-helix transcriptional regulator [Streptomyces sp. NPDC029041]|uniref:MarR family winged helix-turn-helix transcriptional regulator n=1 Tax=Streptomyces sp. NPDC029041 TaxID=3155727 RepID=UPI0033E549F1
MAKRPRQVFDDLARLGTLLSSSIDARLRRECGLPLSSLRVLLAAADHTPACRVQDIADALVITVGGASQAVDRLEQRGLCVRRCNPADRRSSLVDLTPAGRNLLDEAAPVYDQELDTLLSVSLPEASFTELAHALAALRGAVAVGVPSKGGSPDRVGLGSAAG